MGAQAAAIGNALRRELERACIALTLEIDKELRRAPGQGGTPVDTGHARANWVPSVGAPHLEEVDGNLRGSSAHAAGVREVLRFKLADGYLYISNNVPYIEALNAGHSAQAPRLFIEAAVDRAIATINARYEGRILIDRASVLGSTRGGREYLNAELAENIAEAYSPFGGN